MLQFERGSKLQSFAFFHVFVFVVVVDIFWLFRYFSQMLRHVVDKHVKIHHICHVCMTSNDSKKESNQDVKGVFKLVHITCEKLVHSKPRKMPTFVGYNLPKPNKALMFSVSLRGFSRL